MERKIKLASPFVFLLLSVWLFVEAGFFSTPANDLMAESLDATTARLGESLSRGKLPSIQTLERQRARRELLLGVKSEYGAVPQEPPGETLESILKEWGYRQEDPLAAALSRLEDRIMRNLGGAAAGRSGGDATRVRNAVQTFVNNMARKAAEADLFTSLTLDVVEESSPFVTDQPSELPVVTLAFSFISGVAEAVQFIESWVLDSPPGILVTPGQISFMRVEPDLWGSSLKYFSGPPVRTDLTFTVILNLENP
jgi:hypothetical protein